MLVYDITNEKSFDNIRNWIRNIEEVRLRETSTLLLLSSHPGAPWFTGEITRHRATHRNLSRDP